MTERLKVALIGDGNVGSALSRGLTDAGHETRTTGKDPKQVRELAGWGDVVVLAVPFPAREDAVRTMGDAVAGKPLIDVTNALDQDHGFAGSLRESGAEGLQRMVPDAHVVKAFNTVFAGTMTQGMVRGERLSTFVAGDDGEAKGMALRLARDIGFDAVDAGPLENARWLEALGFFNIQLGYALGLGAEMGLRVVHEGNAREERPRAAGRGTTQRS